LPLKLAGMSACFRKEAGAHGKDTRGIFRTHQFNKIEQFVFCKPEESWKLHEELISNAEELVQKLGLPYRVVNVCTGDIGTVAAKKYDIEVWMPAQNAYREIVSCSNCTDYQARRLDIRYREKEGAPPKGFLHTLNSTAIATGRTIVAILENFQQENGTVVVPKVLRKYMGDIAKISLHGSSAAVLWKRGARHIAGRRTGTAYGKSCWSYPLRYNQRFFASILENVFPDK
jgi:seryl-tRNA synthetase